MNFNKALKLCREKNKKFCNNNGDLIYKERGYIVAKPFSIVVKIDAEWNEV